jgi:hypothetical protein
LDLRDENRRRYVIFGPQDYVNTWNYVIIPNNPAKAKPAPLPYFSVKYWK